eukprot:scaffold40397_cov228-Skeletonema_dohrnii-CCMP3373.AAC.1
MLVASLVSAIVGRQRGPLALHALMVVKVKVRDKSKFKKKMGKGSLSAVSTRAKSKRNTEYGARTHDHTIKSRALFQLS